VASVDLGSQFCVGWCRTGCRGLFGECPLAFLDLVGQLPQPALVDSAEGRDVALGLGRGLDRFVVEGHDPAGLTFVEPDPGKDVDLYITSSLVNLVRIWEGDLDIKQAQREGLLKTQGSRQLGRSLPDWLGICLYADVRPGDPELMKVAADD